jgi:aminodeoxyfutalosine deaminase
MLTGSGKIKSFERDMTYRKLSGQQLFTGREMLGADAVLVLDAAGVVAGIVPVADAGDDVEKLPGILCPGLVNAHCHLELSHLKGVLPEHTGLVPFLSAVQQHRFFAPEQVQEAMVNAEAEMRAGGIVAVGDIGNTTDSLAIKQQHTLHWHSFVEVIGFTEEKAAERLHHYQEILQQFHPHPQSHPQPHSYSHSYSTSSLSPHAPYTISKKMFGLINEVTAGQVVSIHNQECAAEDELYRSRSGQFLELYEAVGINSDFFEASGKSSLQTWLPYFNRGQRILLVHNTFTSEADVLFAQQWLANSRLAGQASAVHWCLCPNANLYIENKLPPVDLLQRHDCHIVLGTDSLSSNHQLSIVEEMSTLRKFFPQLGWEVLLRWATLNGAEALGMESMLGSFDKGKKPGWVVIEA